MRKYKNINSLETAILKKEEKLREERNNSTKKFANIRFGHSMRRTKINISFSKEDKLKSDLQEMYILLDELKDKK